MRILGIQWKQELKTFKPNELRRKAGLMFITMIGMTQQEKHLDLPPFNSTQ